MPIPANQLFEQTFLNLIAPGIDAEIEETIKELIRATRRQHTCIDLSGYTRAKRQRLEDQAFIGGPDSGAPLIIEGNKLFLAKYHEMEVEVASKFKALNHAGVSVDQDWLAASLTEHFGDDLANRQRLAAVLAVTRHLTIISGGPGTGKTSTVSRILTMLKDDSPDLIVKLAAPTGKAAMRLTESLRERQEDSDPGVTTIHRLLGMRADGRSFRHDRYNPIQADVLVIDEASMIDLRLMHRLLDALPRGIRLILLGDPNQLPSVDSGNVLADLCAAEPVFTEAFMSANVAFIDLPDATIGHHGLSDAICHLNRNYRFSEESAVGRLAIATQQGIARFENSEDQRIQVRPPLNLSTDTSALVAPFEDYLSIVASGNAAPQSLLASFSETRILASYRAGSCGVRAINQHLEDVLSLRGLRAPGDVFYPGRPVMVTRNDYRIELYNGDVGICVPDSEGEMVAFPGKDPAAPRMIAASRLPEHETCFAMTVHKSQGSEFTHVSLVLNDREQEEDELLTRELIYTAITRAKQTITIHGAESDWIRAMQTRAARVSGMVDFLIDK